LLYFFKEQSLILSSLIIIRSKGITFDTRKTVVENISNVDLNKTTTINQTLNDELNNKNVNNNYYSPTTIDVINQNNQVVVVVQGDDNNNNIDINNEIQLIDSEYSKKLELFDKYGDYKRVQHAATLIQSAYRQYKLKKNYYKIYENNIKRRSLNVDKLNSLLNDLFIPSSSSDSGLTTSTSSSPPQHHSTDKTNSIGNYSNNTFDNLLTSSSSLSSFDNKKNSLILDCVDTVSSENKVLSSSSSSSISLNNNANNKPLSANLEAENLAKDHLDSVLKKTNDEKLANEKHELNSCTSVHSVYSNSTVSSKSSYLSSGSSILSNTNKANAEMIKLSPNSSNVSSLNDKTTSPKSIRQNIVSSSIDRKLMIGITLFNQTPKMGIEYLFENNYIDYSPRSIARFLLTNKLLSKQRITDYISNERDEFSRLVLKYVPHHLYVYL
jgi:hypothetical protein